MKKSSTQKNNEVYWTAKLQAIRVLIRRTSGLLSSLLIIPKEEMLVTLQNWTSLSQNIFKSVTFFKKLQNKATSLNDQSKFTSTKMSESKKTRVNTAISSNKSHVRTYWNEGRHLLPNPHLSRKSTTIKLTNFFGIDSSTYTTYIYIHECYKACEEELHKYSSR